MLRDLGIRPASVLRRADLPGDLFAREKATLTTEEYFRLWRAFEDETGDSTLPLRIGGAISVEVFDPPIFASLCSPDLNTALERIAHYKRLVLPMALHIDRSKRATSVELEWLDAPSDPPTSLILAELAFFVQLARLASRTKVCPLELRSPQIPEEEDKYADYFGVRIRKGASPKIVFSPADGALPFLTANDEMWRFFEPELRRRLSELDQSATMAERVKGALLELLPSGETSMEAVAKKLGTSGRTLQRRLGEDGQTFQALLNKTREGLARHYLRSSNLTGAEISFLLGFGDPNSFFRAFHSWTGVTPQQIRDATA